MTLATVKGYLSSGLDDAIVRTVKSALRFGVAAALTYLVAQVAGVHPTTEEGVLGVAIVDRVLKFLMIYIGTPAPVTYDAPTSEILV